MEYDPPRYREAYPELDMAEASRGGHSGVRRVTWYDEHRQSLGQGELQWLEYEVLISCELRATEYLQAVSRSRRLHVGFLQRGLHNHRTCVRCPVCSKLVPKLYLHLSDWACADCQGLRFRSTFLTSQQRWAEEYAILDLEIKEGRPFRMRETSYRKKLDRLQSLRGKLVGERKQPGFRFMHGVRAKWDFVNSSDGGAGR